MDNEKHSWRTASRWTRRFPTESIRQVPDRYTKHNCWIVLRVELLIVYQYCLTMRKYLTAWIERPTGSSLDTFASHPQWSEWLRNLTTWCFAEPSTKDSLRTASTSRQECSKNAPSLGFRAPKWSEWSEYVSNMVTIGQKCTDGVGLCAGVPDTPLSLPCDASLSPRPQSRPGSPPLADRLIDTVVWYYLSPRAPRLQLGVVGPVQCISDTHLWLFL